MKRALFAAPAIVLGLTAAHAAFAQHGGGGEVLPMPEAKSTLSRADVKAGAAMAVNSGRIPGGEWVIADDGKSTRERSEVKAEAASARKVSAVSINECN